MDISQNNSADSGLNQNETRTFETMLPRLRRGLFLGFCIFGGGALFSALNIFGFISRNGLKAGNGTASVWQWSLIVLSGLVGLAFLAAMIFVRPLALRVILRAKNRARFNSN